MAKNLVIVESPAKAKTIKGFLGKDFEVKSSFGHVRDLSKSQIGIDIENGFMPSYEVSADKKKIIAELIKSAKAADFVWLASDEDREGEAISWHLAQVLDLEEKKIKRIVFHEITKNAIKDAVDNPRSINLDLVNAQQARRVLDRLVGYELSPLLWKKVKPSLSAGRVQSVAVRIIVEREEEIKAFTSVSSFKVVAKFEVSRDDGNRTLEAELPRKFKNEEEAHQFLKSCVDAEFSVLNIEKKPAKKSPSPPFTTSTLQQEASRKLGFSVSRTMTVAQQLYESGKITYIRTDSVHLSGLALSISKKTIAKLYGEEYSKTRQFVTKSKGAQEAHEAIRPTYIDQQWIEGDAAQKKLYDLIWKRTIASQMSDAKLEKTNVNIDISTAKENFIASGEVLLFEGFLKVYFESRDEEEENGQKGMLPLLHEGEKLDALKIEAIQRFTKNPPRYTEASLVKKLEELGIGRPSTYAPIISTIQKREYVVKEDRPGLIRDYTILTLQKGKIKESHKKEKTGYEKAKMFPTDIGTHVNKFLTQYFPNILDYHFTASVEKEFDEIADGQKVWNKMIEEFYGPFHLRIEETEENTAKFSGEKLLGTDPGTGKNVYVKVGRYGPMVQLGETSNEEKPKFAGLKKGQSMDTITLEEAMEMLKFPIDIGEYEGSELQVGLGKYGPFVKHEKKFYSIDKSKDPSVVTREEAIEIIEEQRSRARKMLIKEFDENPDIKILDGKYGPYISNGKRNYKIPRDKDPASLNIKECLEIIENTPLTKKGRGSGARKRKSS